MKNSLSIQNFFDKLRLLGVAILFVNSQFLDLYVGALRRSLNTKLYRLFLPCRWGVLCPHGIVVDLMLFMLINISRVARQGVDCQRGPRKSLPAFWGALQFVGIVVNNIFLVFAPFSKQ